MNILTYTTDNKYLAVTLTWMLCGAVFDSPKIARNRSYCCRARHWLTASYVPDCYVSPSASLVFKYLTFWVAEIVRVSGTRCRSVLGDFPLNAYIYIVCSVEQETPLLFWNYIACSSRLKYFVEPVCLRGISFPMAKVTNQSATDASPQQFGGCSTTPVVASATSQASGGSSVGQKSRLKVQPRTAAQLAGYVQTN